MNNGRVTILLLTYKRLEYAKRTLRAALDNIRYSGELAVHIADDGSGEDHITALREIAGGYESVVCVGHSDAQRGGYGRNYNLATQQIHPASEFVLPLEDDWELCRELSLDPLCGVLRKSDSIGCIRLGYLGFTDKLVGHVERVDGQAFLVLDEASPEKHVFAGHPRLETVAWEQWVGPWPENLNPGATELQVCSFARNGIAWPMDLGWTGGSLFQHIGAQQSY